MAGMRLDYNFAYNQLFWTPRIHLKWQAAENTSIRVSAGKGYRVSNILTENQSLLISNREFVFADNVFTDGSMPMNQGLRPEEAYNTGISFVQGFKMPGWKIHLQRGLLLHPFHQPDHHRHGL